MSCVDDKEANGLQVKPLVKGQGQININSCCNVKCS